MMTAWERAQGVSGPLKANRILATQLKVRARVLLDTAHACKLGFRFSRDGGPNPYTVQRETAIGQNTHHSTCHELRYAAKHVASEKERPGVQEHGGQPSKSSLALILAFS
eukprot:1142924-Pelagomonas_calceolata.AAC.2